MTEMKSEGGQSYTIPLDSIDWKYLGTYVRTSTAEKRRLWTRKRLDGESEYCHVQIVTQDDIEDCYSEETFDTYFCHICNVEVPILCFKKHNESEKHATLKTIFQKVLEKVSKQINISVINNDKDIDKDMYYCMPCSKIVKIGNKLKHESSAYHVKSQRSINVVYAFYKIFEENKAFVGDKEVENKEILDGNRDLTANKFDIEIIQNDTKNNYVTNENSENSSSNNDETKTDCSTNDNSMKPTCTVEHLIPNEKHNKELTSEENYFKDMVKKYNLKVNLPIVDGEFIHVATPSGVKVKISRDHFHSFYQYKVGGTSIYCQMCNELETVDFGEESKHKVSEKHARNVFLPVNEQFARTLNDYISHCLICNKVILTSHLIEHHLNDDNHVKRLNSTTLTDICQNNEDLADGINTENIIEQAHSENHVNKSEENKMITYINYKECISKVNFSENDSGDATSVQKLVFCELCNVSVPQDQIEYHNAGTPHWSNAIKKICTGVAEGLQKYFSKDSDSSEIQNDKPKNDNVTNQNTLKNDNAANQNNTLKNGNAANQNNTLKNGNAANQNNTLKNGNEANQYNTLKNGNEANQNNTLKNGNEANQNNTLKNGNEANQNNTLKNGNAANQNNTLKKGNAANQTNTLKNGNAANQNNTLKDGNEANQNNTLKNGNEANQYNTLKNGNEANQNNTLKNGNEANQNNALKNGNEANQNITLKNDKVASTSVSNITNNEIGSSSPFRYADSTNNKVTCIVCDLDMANVLQNITTHKASPHHNTCLRQLLKFHTIKQNPERSFCECCCDTNVTNIWTHIATERHTALLQLEYEIETKPLKLYVYKNKTRSHNAIMCRELYKMLLETNKIYKLKLNSNFYCSFCQLELCGKGNEIHHMFTAEHEKWLKNIFQSR